jgi:hypothetical protein
MPSFKFYTKSGKVVKATVTKGARVVEIGGIAVAKILSDVRLAWQGNTSAYSRLVELYRAELQSHRYTVVLRGKRRRVGF